MSHPSALAAKVAAVNNANRYANALHPLLTEALAPFIGCKVIKVDGSLLKTIQAALPTFPNTVPLSVYRGSSGYSLYWVVKTCEGIAPHGCVYHEVSVYVGKLNGQTLESWDGCKWEPHRTDWTPDEVAELREKAEKAKRAASDAESAVHEFGMYDR